MNNRGNIAVRRMRRAQYVLAAILAPVLLQSCFTGIESTPRIGESELRRQHVTTTPEQKFLSDVVPQAPAQWSRGKEFHVTDSRIRLIFTTASTGTDSLAGEVIRFCRFDTVPAVDSHEAAEAIFTHGSDTLRWRPGFDIAELAGRSRLDVPFTVDMDLLAQVKAQMLGHTYYITTPLWYDPQSLQAVNGLRHIPVEITDVRAGTADMPFNVVFSPGSEAADTTSRSVLMTIGSDRLATRNFHRLFAFENPRRRYLSITDEVWKLIIHSKVRQGMTRDECRLALGAPLQIVYGNNTAGTAERWSYPDGVYLIFDDGLLSRFRQ
ncbi:MAG: hypothetical protein K2G24_04675 [Muribaculaceae bacterium]|nr:hypothetical protein [Muribaculaceae bacterium]